MIEAAAPATTAARNILDTLASNIHGRQIMNSQLLS